MLNYSARLVKLQPVTVTFLITDGFYERATKELARSFEDGEEAFAQRVR